MYLPLFHGTVNMSTQRKPSVPAPKKLVDVPSSPKPEEASRRSSLAPRKPSASAVRPPFNSAKSGSAGLKRAPPKLARKESSPGSPSPSPAKKPSTAPRRPSNLSSKPVTAGEKRKPPKLPPKKDNAKSSAPAKGQKSSAALEKEIDAKMKRLDTQDSKNGKAAHKIDEEEQDLKSILSDEQCQDLIRLTSGITKRMRQSIEENFDATATLEKIKKENSKEDGFANLDFDPGTVDVSAYDKERKVRDERQKELSTPKMKELKKASLKWFDDWRAGFLKRVNETVKPKESSSQQPARVAEANGAPMGQVQKIDAKSKSDTYTPPKLEQLFPRIATSLTKLSIAERAVVLHSFLLLLLSSEHYTAASRVFLLYLASSLKLGLRYLREDEEKTAKGLLEVAKQMSASQEAMKKGKESEESRKWKLRLATVAGAAVIGLSGGYAAPLIAASVGTAMSELGLGASAAAGYLGTVAGNTYLVGSLFGAYGGRMTGDMMRNLSADVQDFAFLPVHGERKEHEETVDAVTDNRRLRVIISITGWLLEKEEVVTPWRVLSPSAEVFALRFELETLMKMGQSFNTMAANSAYGYAQSAFATRAAYTELSSAIWPLALVKIARVVENPFNLAKARAEKAGKVLAEALITRTQGERPVTLIGYSLGARVIWSCLTTLAERKVFGLVESAVLIGSPIPSDINTWRVMRTAVSGRLVNVYSTNDYLLGFLHRASSLQYGVAGLIPISGLLGVENVDVSESVSGHLRYRYVIGSILQKIGFEDIDKAEVAKEAEAFKIMEEEESKQDYTKDAKDIAGEAYDQYQKRLKQVTSKKITDADADKQAKAMEKEVHQKTQKGLMQWAVEQLYLSPPSVPTTGDVADAKSNPQGAVKGTAKTANKTADAATKSMYQRAKEAVYISRSGGPEGQEIATDRVAQAQSTASSAAPNTYLATAAGYIPTGYIPSFRSADVPKDLASDAKAKVGSPQAAKDLPKGPKSKQPSSGGLAKSGRKKSEKPNPKRAGSVSTQGSASKLNLTPTTTTTDEEKILTPSTEEPTTPALDAQDKTKDTPKAAGETTGAMNDKMGDTPSAAKKPTTSVGVSSYLPLFGFGSSSKAKEEGDSTESPKTSKDGNGKDSKQEPASEEAGTPGHDTAKESSEDDKPDSSKDGAALETEEGKPAAAEGIKSDKDKEAHEKDDEEETPPAEAASAKPEEEGSNPEENAPQTSEDKDEGIPSESEGSKTPRAEQSSGYSSYIPSFGFGSSYASKPKNDVPGKQKAPEKPKESQKAGLEDPFTE